MIYWTDIRNIENKQRRLRGKQVRSMYLMIDNYDSFVYNLRAYFEEAGHEILVVENDGITIGQIRQMKPEGIIISPGPKTPKDAGI